MNSQSNLSQLPKPQHLKLGNNLNFNWNYGGRLGSDCCAISLHQSTSTKPGIHHLSGFDPTCENSCDYGNRMSEIMHFQKVYPNNLCYPDENSSLLHSELTNMRQLNQLFTRPYLGSYMGAGQSSLDNKDLESALQQSTLTNLKEKPCQVTRGTTFHRYQCLPEYGNPQRIQHVEPPPPEIGGWQRGGNPTRDYVRRVDHQRRCQNKINNTWVNKSPLLLE